MGIFDIFKGGNSFMRGYEDYKAAEGAMLIDVRSPKEYAEGHVPGSVNMMPQELTQLKVAKDTPMFVYCLSGARSARAVTLLEKMGFTNVRNLGGISSYKGPIEK